MIGVVLRKSFGFGLICLLAACSDMPVGEMPELAGRREAPNATPLPPMARFPTHAARAPSQSNAEIARDFLDLSFQMESGRPIRALSRFEGPVTVRVSPGAPATLGPDLDVLLARLRAEARIDITRVTQGTASITIETLPRARMQRAVPNAACFVVPRVSGWDEFRRARRTPSQLDWTTLERRDQVAVFIPNDVSPQEIRDCLHEEIGQALGPLNDLYRLTDSVFNDDNFNAVLTDFDMLILRAYYDAQMPSGISRAEAASRLPSILARINPGGQRGPGSQTQSPDRQWIELIETALGGNSSTPARIAAAERALSIARNRGWQDSRLGFSYFALGRLTLSQSPNLSVSSFIAAGNHYRNTAPGSVQIAHINMQLAAFALSAGEAEQVLTLVGEALPAATRAENASLLATLLMMRAEALALQGRVSEAQAVRRDALAWGRYGFGRDQAVRSRLSEVAALSPRQS